MRQHGIILRLLLSVALDDRTDYLSESIDMFWINALGFSAALSVLASFCMTKITALRSVALLSNVLFVLYGCLAHIYPVLLLHAVLFPVNVIKLYRIQSESWSVRSAESNLPSKRRSDGNVFGSAKYKNASSGLG